MKYQKKKKKLLESKPIQILKFTTKKCVEINDD